MQVAHNPAVVLVQSLALAHLLIGTFPEIKQFGQAGTLNKPGRCTALRFVAHGDESVDLLFCPITDLREKLIFAPLIALTLLFGVYPSLVTDLVGPSVADLVNDVTAAQAAYDPAALTAPMQH